VAAQSNLASLSVDQVATVVLRHKEEASRALADAAVALEQSRTEKARAESLSVDLRALRGDYARLSDALLHLQTERLELKASAEQAARSLAPAKDKANTLELQLSYAAAQQAAVVGELELLQAQVAKAVAKHAVEKEALRFALGGAKQHIVAMETKLQGLAASVARQTAKAAVLELELAALVAAGGVTTPSASPADNPEKKTGFFGAKGGKAVAAAAVPFEATPERHAAATKIQGKARQKRAKKRFWQEKDAAAVTIEATPETNAAATKLQGRARMKAAQQKAAQQKAAQQKVAAKRAGGEITTLKPSVTQSSQDDESTETDGDIPVEASSSSAAADGSQRASAVARAAALLDATRAEAAAAAAADAVSLAARLAASEARVARMAADRKKLVFALEAAKGHIVKLTGRLAVGDGYDDASGRRSGGPPRSAAAAELTRKHVRASLASLAPGALEAALAEQAAAEDAASEAKVAAVLEQQEAKKAAGGRGGVGGLGFAGLPTAAFGVFGAVGDFDLEAFAGMRGKGDKDEEEETKGAGPADEASIFSFFGL